MNRHRDCSDDRRVTIAIVGGGIAGICLALGILEHAHDRIQVHIYEAAPKFQEIGAGVSFGINAQRALWRLDRRAGAAYAALATSNADLNSTPSASGDCEKQKETYLRLVMGIDHASDPGYKAGTEICEVFCEGGFSKQAEGYNPSSRLR